jgi:hypothetical protein
MRHLLIALPLLLMQVPAAHAQVSVSIGINLPVYPQLQRVPGYPVYYAPGAPGNYFFYDGLYWVFEDDAWYYSSWYNGPWYVMGPEYVPVYLLRVPVRYYRRPPVYFSYWQADAPPRWNEHWGRDWEQRRPGWDRWDRRTAPAPAPLPDYQRKYSQGQYPHAAQQDRIRGDNYRYQPREPVVRAQLAPPQRVAPRPEEREPREQREQQEDVRKPERPDRPARPDRPDRVERVERSAPLVRPPDSELRRPEQRASPEPRILPQVQPQARPEPPPQRQPPQQGRWEQPRGAESVERGPDRKAGPPGQRPMDREERPRHNDRGDRGNRGG